MKTYSCHTSIQDISVLIEFEHEKAEPDVNACEVFTIVTVLHLGIDIIELVDQVYIDELEEKLEGRNIGDGEY